MNRGRQEPELLTTLRRPAGEGGRREQPGRESQTEREAHRERVACGFEEDSTPALRGKAGTCQSGCGLGDGSEHMAEDGRRACFRGCTNMMPWNGTPPAAARWDRLAPPPPSHHQSQGAWAPLSPPPPPSHGYPCPPPSTGSPRLSGLCGSRPTSYLFLDVGNLLAPSWTPLMPAGPHFSSYFSSDSSTLSTLHIHPTQDLAGKQ